MFYTNQIRSSYQWYQSSDLRPWVMVPTTKKTDDEIFLDDVRSLQQLCREIRSSLAFVDERLTVVDERLTFVDERITSVYERITSMETPIAEVKKNLAYRITDLEHLLKLRKVEDQQSSEEKKPEGEEIQTSEEIESAVGGSLKRVDQVLKQEEPISEPEATEAAEEERSGKHSHNAKKKKRKRWKKYLLKIWKFLVVNRRSRKKEKTSLSCGNEWYAFVNTRRKDTVDHERGQLRDAEGDKHAYHMFDRMHMRRKRVIKESKRNKMKMECVGKGIKHNKKGDWRLFVKLLRGYISYQKQLVKRKGFKFKRKHVKPKKFIKERLSCNHNACLWIFKLEHELFRKIFSQWCKEKSGCERAYLRCVNVSRLIGLTLEDGMMLAAKTIWRKLRITLKKRKARIILRATKKHKRTILHEEWVLLILSEISYNSSVEMVSCTGILTERTTDYEIRVEGRLTRCGEGIHKKAELTLQNCNMDVDDLHLELDSSYVILRSLRLETLENLEVNLNEIEDEQKKKEELRKNSEGLCKTVKNVLGDKVEMVIVYDLVVDYPCRLVTGEYSWTADMERIRKAQILGDNSMHGYIHTKNIMESGIKVQMLINATVMDEYFKSGNSTKGLNLLEEKLKLDVEVTFFIFFPEESTSQLRSSSKDIGRGVVTDVTFIGEHSEDHLSSFFSYGRFGSPRPPERSYSHPIPFKTALLTFGVSFDESNIIRSIIHRVYKLGLRVDNEQVENRKVQRLPLARWESKSDVFAFRAAIQLNMACTEINRDLGQGILHALLNVGYGSMPRTHNGIGELLYWEEMVIAGLLKLLPNPPEIEDKAGPVLRGTLRLWSVLQHDLGDKVNFNGAGIDTCGMI